MTLCKHADFVFGKKSRRLICKLGLYGGQVTLGDCKLCIEKGNNNEEYAKQLFDRVKKTHPSGVARISGCCDSARNYID